MLELAIHAGRGSFRLHVECRFASAWTVLFGPSGSGKTTLLRILAGLDTPARRGPDTARISLDSRPLTDSRSGLATHPGPGESERKTSLVTQQPSLFPHLSVAANIAYGLRSLDRAARHARVDEMLELVDGRQLISRRPRNLSGGEAQRIALARALAPRPRLLLLDEPLSALDGAASDTLLARLQPWLREHSVQTILATHDATDAFATSADVALLHEGRLAAFGPATQVLSSERARLFARLGSSPSPVPPLSSPQSPST